jgi:hypothetical protein
MPDDDPLQSHPEMYPERHVPPVCDRYPTCKGYLDPVTFADDPLHPYPGDCTYPACNESSVMKGTPTP